MNFLTLIFSLLLIVSFGTHLILEKQNSQKQLRNSSLGHIAAQRKMISQVEDEAFKGIALPITPTEKTSSMHPTKKPFTLPKINPECAKINLFSLIEDGKEKETLLYELMMKLIKNVYGPHLFKDPKEAGPFLMEFLQAAKRGLEKKETFAIEKLILKKEKWQRTYYQMLKGSPNYPSFLDLVKVEESRSKICISHAHPVMLRLLFGDAVTKRLIEELQEDPPTPLTKELIERLYVESRLLPPETSLLNAIDYRPSHIRKNKKAYIATDDATKITLKKNIYTEEGNFKVKVVP